MRVRSGQKISGKTMLFFSMLIYKFATDIAYWYVLTVVDAVTYTADFNLFKYIAGIIVCIILFFGIDFKGKKASTFLLYLVFLLQIIPITTIYSMANDSTAYYFATCTSFFACEILVAHTNAKKLLKRKLLVSQLMLFAFAFFTALLFVAVIKGNGLPGLTALNIYKVYEMRAAGTFQISKYMNYILTWATGAFLPIFLAKSILDKKYHVSAICVLAEVVIYLYTGHKTYLFSIPLVVACSIWSRRENFFVELFFCFCVGFALLVTALFVTEQTKSGVFYEIYSLFGRRCIIVPANNKFKYFDFFSNYPKLGIYGILPTWILDVDSYYENVKYTYLISEIYYNKPDMNSNTGFLAEGYMRFGYIGIPMIMLLFAVVLKMVDGLQLQTSYPLAVSLFVYPVFSLADAHLLSSMFFGPWMIYLFILIFYKGKKGSVS